MTVSKALSKGNKNIKNPMLIFFIVVNGITLSASADNIEIRWIFFLVLPITIIICFIWWSITITKWRIWAFTNCHNVHELKRRAINEKLIGKDGGMFEKLEIRTKKQKEQLKILHQKFDIEDTFEEIKDDKSIEKETNIYFSKIILVFNSLNMILIFSGGVYLLKGGLNIIAEIVAYFMIFLALSVSYYFYVKHKDNKPYITINSEGIKTLKTPFTPWENIEYIHTKRKGIGKNERWYLKFNDEINDLDITNLSKTPNAIEDLIALYQQRNRKNKIR